MKRFSPTWNLGAREAMPGAEIRVLLATDIVSEGQNLQDCACVLNYDLHWNPVRLIQRFGRVDPHWHRARGDQVFTTCGPTLQWTRSCHSRERLHRRIQSFHDLIGLDSKLLSDAERLNASAMYRIYDGKALPEMDDGLDEVAANQRAITLLQRIQDEDPDLWQTITRLPDGIRSALSAHTRQPSASNDRYAQSVLEVEGAQAPLMSPATMASITSPFDDPRQGETLVLMSAAGVRSCYAIDSGLQPRAISPAQLIAAAECSPDTPTQSLPADTNERVMAAFDTFSTDFQRRLGRARRPAGHKGAPLRLTPPQHRHARGPRGRGIAEPH